MGTQEFPVSSFRSTHPNRDSPIRPSGFPYEKSARADGAKAMSVESLEARGMGPTRKEKSQ
jgi:hypothetical protein